MLSFKSSPERGESRSHQNQCNYGWRNWNLAAEPEISLWVLDEPFEFGVLPVQPCSKISISLLRKVSAYIKTKNMYPALNLSAWLHISQLKLQMGTHIPWIYLRMYDILKQQMNRNDKNVGYWDFRCEQLRKGRKDKKDEFRVPTFEFLIFLYIQNSYKVMKRISTQMTNALKRQDGRWAVKAAEPKIQSEQLHYQYVCDNIEEIIDYLQEGYKSKEEVSLTIIEALNLLFCCTTNPRECVMDYLEIVVSSPRISSYLDFNPTSQTVNRSKFIQWIRTLLKLNPWGSASSFIHSPKIYPPSGSFKSDNKDISLHNRIIFNQKKPPNAWAVLSNVCFQVFYHEQRQELCNLKVHRCNGSYIYAPGVYSCIFVDKCVNSTIFLGVAAKVVKLFGCSNVRVYCVARLVIITDCVKSMFQLLTPCQPILTGNKNGEIQLAPYGTHYPGLEEHMLRADLKPNVNCWNDPLQIGVDGMSAVEFEPSILSFVPPQEIHCFTFPFDIPGSTAKHSSLLPDDYQEALDRMDLEFNEWRKSWSHVALSPALKLECESEILAAFKKWLDSTGYGLEVDGLTNLKNTLEGRFSDNREADWIFGAAEFYENPQSFAALREMVGVFNPDMGG